MEYLGYTMLNVKILVPTKKVEVVEYRPLPTTQKEVYSFVELCNFYAKFIHHLSEFTGRFANLLWKVPATKSYADACMF
jgi:hypothetical protein